MKPLKIIKGRRYLLYDKQSMGFVIGDPDIMEVKCLELSLKGRVKLKFASGITIWELPNKFEIVEVL